MKKRDICKFNVYICQQRNVKLIIFLVILSNFTDLFNFYNLP